jgi:quercetin dioxygenase-like cupin family protein
MADESFVVRRLSALPREAAHGGSGARQVIFSTADGLSPHLEAVTKGFLDPGALFDWHQHDVDEFFIVLSGSGHVFHGDETDEGMPYEPGDVFYCKAGLRHKIVSSDSASEYIFVRLSGSRG